MEDQAHKFQEIQELVDRIELLFQAGGTFTGFEELERRKREAEGSWLQRLKFHPWVQWLQRWYDKSEPGLMSAAMVSFAALTFGGQRSVPFWIPLFLFPVMNPVYAMSIFTGQVIPFFYDREKEYTVEEADECNASLYVLSGYVGWLFGLQLSYWSVIIAYFFWEHPLFTLTLFSCAFLLYRHKPWLEYCRTKSNSLLYVTFKWIGNSYNRIQICVQNCAEWLAQASATRLFAFCVRRVLVLVLRQPNFDNLAKFVYEPLDVENGEIRLLKIHRRIPFCDLTCELVHVSLDEAPPYQAISYYWGTNLEKGERIILGTKQVGSMVTAYKQFRVTSTVFNVLWQRSSIFASRLIWIDSLCINQADSTEKGRQVQLMSNIFKTASRVFVCLGDSPDARFGISLLHELVFMNNLVSKTTLAKHILAYSNRVDKGDELLKSRLTGLLDLLHHPWFGRIWIIQEVVVAKSLTVLYSNYVLVWDYLILFMEIFEDSEMSQIKSQFDSSGQDFISTPPPSGPRNARPLSDFQKMFRRGQRAPLNELLRVFSAFRSTCPRDKIFALLGFAKPGPGILELIDYDKELSDTLYDVAKYLYFHEGSLLDVLHYAGIGWDGIEVDHPSWVPDWTISREPTTIAHVASDMIDERIQYRCGTQVEPHISLLTESRLLTLRGQKLEKIKYISITPDDFLPSRKNVPVKELDEFASWLENAQLLTEQICRNPYPPTKQSTKEAFWRTLIGDRTLFARPAPASYSTHFKRFMFNISKLRGLANDPDGDGLNVQEMMNDRSYNENNFKTVEESMEWQRDLTNAGWLFGQPGFQRNFCITERGYMGMVPKYAELGDDICLIYGAQVPFVLRALRSGLEESAEHEIDEKGEESEERKVSKEDDVDEGKNQLYQLVGECYVHGMMDGEGLNLGETEQDFTIK